MKTILLTENQYHHYENMMIWCQKHIGKTGWNSYRHSQYFANDGIFYSEYHFTFDKKGDELHFALTWPVR